jgi:hypothetical protein
VAALVGLEHDDGLFMVGVQRFSGPMRTRSPAGPLPLLGETAHRRFGSRPRHMAPWPITK